MANEDDYIKIVELERNADQNSIDVFRDGIRDANRELRGSTEAWLDSFALFSITLGSALVAIGVSLSSDRKFHHPLLFWLGIVALIVNGFIIIVWKKVITELAAPKVDLIGLEEQYLLAKKKQLENDIIDKTIEGVESYKEFLSARIEYIKVVKNNFLPQEPSKKLELRTDIALYLLFVGVLLIASSAFRGIKVTVALLIIVSAIDLSYTIYTIKLYKNSQKKRNGYVEKTRKISIAGLEKEIQKSQSALDLLKRNGS